MDPKGLFRQAALEKLSSPERLDETMRVSAPATHLVVSAMAVLLVVLVVWSCLGKVPEKVQGTGMLQSSAGIVPIVASAQGYIQELKVNLDDQVRTGDVIAKLDLGTLQVAIANEEAKSSLLSMEKPIKDQNDQRRIASLQATLVAATKQQKIVEELYPKGRATISQINAAQDRVRSLRDQIDQKRKELEDRRKELEDSLGNLRKLREQFISGGEVTSPCDGKIIELTTQVGNMLGPGDRIAKVEKVGELMAVVFVPMASGNRVKPGMTAQVSPATVKKEEWGFLRGRVQSISEGAASSDRLVLVFRNEQLVEEMTKQSAANMEIAIRLVKAPGSSPSGYGWTSGVGPATSIYSGTKCEANVTVERRAPIFYAWRFARRALGR